jgi:amidophosphoribosyltransferase
MCGFIGVVGVPSAAREIFVALQTLQHRGQDSAGIATKDGDRFPLLKDMGTVPLALQAAELEKLTGRIGLGHVRYPTFGRPVKEDAQPFFFRQPGVLMAHNGNITNYDELRSQLKESSIHLLSSCDIEPVLCLFAEQLMRARPKAHTGEDALAALVNVFGRVRGAFSIVGVAELDGRDTLFAARDPWGIRPMVWGRRKESFMVASESVALDALGYEVFGEIDAGQFVCFRENADPIVRRVTAPKGHAPCIFEHIYFARPDSILDERTVYETRLALGHRLAEEWKTRGIDVDTVIPVPDTSRPAATAIAEAIGRPMREGFIKNRYFGRTFIMADQPARSLALRLKLNPIRAEIENKRVLLVDDSIVRGNTVRSIVALVRAQGPREVHLAIYSPPVTHPCYYGIDMSTPEELLARRRLGLDFTGPLTIERQREYEVDVARELDVDSITHLSIEGLHAVGTWPKCAACFTGQYPLPLTHEQKHAIEVNRGEVQRV